MQSCRPQIAYRRPPALIGAQKDSRERRKSRLDHPLIRWRTFATGARHWRCAAANKICTVHAHTRQPRHSHALPPGCLPILAQMPARARTERQRANAKLKTGVNVINIAAYSDDGTPGAVASASVRQQERAQRRKLEYSLRRACIQRISYTGMTATYGEILLQLSVCKTSHSSVRKRKSKKTRRIQHHTGVEVLARFLVQNYSSGAQRRKVAQTGSRGCFSNSTPFAHPCAAVRTLHSACKSSEYLFDFRFVRVLVDIFVCL